MDITAQLKWKKIRTIAALTSVFVGVSLVYYIARPLDGVYDFNEKRDTTAIINLFRREWDWLVLSPDYSPEFILKFKTPSQNPLDIGKLNIKVLYANNSFAGFVTYHKEEDKIGRLLFLAVHQDFSW